MTTDMIKTEITYKDGNQYVLDADFNNGSIITLVSHGNIYGRVKSEDSEWETMLNRLTEIPQWAKQYFQFTQQPKAHTVTAWVWVKASERLPEKEKPVLINCNGYYRLAYYRDKWFLKGTNVVYAYEYQNPQIEWLEQVQLPIQGYSLEQVGKAYDAGFNRGYDQQNVLNPSGNIYPDKEQFIKSLTNEQPTTDTD